MHGWKLSEELERKLSKLSRKNKLLYDQILRKINDIIRSGDIEHYKNLRYNMKDSKRVHIGSFVLVFQYDKRKNMINFDDFDHHDKIYKK